MAIEAKAMRRLAKTFEDPLFWRGALAARIEAALSHDEAVTRLHRLAALAEAGEDVMASPEFERWLGYDYKTQRKPFHVE